MRLDFRYDHDPLEVILNRRILKDRSKCLKYQVALLMAGSAILLFSCEEQKQADLTNEETLISQAVDSMMVVTTRNGKKTNVFITPIMEKYEFASVPFTEYRQGIEVIAYNDSTGVETSHIVSNYALHWTDRDLWELKGNVVAKGENGQTLYSQQLTWDRKTQKIYSNVDSKVEEGEDEYIVEGFEANEDLSGLTFRRLTGKVSVDVEPSQPEPAVPVNDSMPIQPASQPAEKAPKAVPKP